MNSTVYHVIKRAMGSEWTANQIGERNYGRKDPSSPVSKCCQPFSYHYQQLSLHTTGHVVSKHKSHDLPPKRHSMSTSWLTVSDCPTAIRENAGRLVFHWLATHVLLSFDKPTDISNWPLPRVELE